MSFYAQALNAQDSLLENMTQAYRMDESECVKRLLAELAFDDHIEAKIARLAETLVVKQRWAETNIGGVEALMQHYDLSTEEGIVLMCLAEALLRIPDKETERLLIKDKLSGADWRKHVNNSHSTFVNLASFGLALSGKILTEKREENYFQKVWANLLQRSGEPVIRKAVREAVKLMSHQFVLGQTIEEALDRSKELRQKGYTFSFDMLGEVARTRQDAKRYYQSYANAIKVLTERTADQQVFRQPSVSVKLSALYPRYEYSQREQAVPFLTERLKSLCLLAKMGNIAITVDAEEADRLEMSLEIIKRVFTDPQLADWEGLGLAVQAYQKRARYVLDWLIDLARQQGRRLHVRLVKGAYWDSEIKVSQVEGFKNYPVFTRKVSTDVSYLACAKHMLSAQDAIYPQFATHNAYSVAAIITMMGDYHRYQFEFQNLQGMGKSLHDQIVSSDGFNIPCRVYAPCGSHKDLLPYLVRRLLENGANSSFVNKIHDEKTSIQDLIASPVAKVKNLTVIPNTKIPLPINIYGSLRRNSQGVDLSNHDELQQLEQQMTQAAKNSYQTGPFGQIPKAAAAQADAVINPANTQQIVGKVLLASTDDAEQALVNASAAFNAWDRQGVIKRAAILLKMADLLEQHHAELMTLIVKEAGRVLRDAMSEVREAVDFCRYYALQAQEHLMPEILPGPTGESNVLSMRGRGTILCISPWNFPVAIFTGQIAAALVTGNCVIAKPAEDTPLAAHKVVELFHAAGVPHEVLQLLPGTGSEIGAKLVADKRVNGVVFTGSTGVAHGIAKTLATRGGPIAPLIAETGGLNAMIADSSALPEQLVADVIMSAFGSAGQRCSALRLLFVQEDIADGVIEMLAGAMAELKVGDPWNIATDVGPVINSDAQQMLLAHQEKMQQQAKLIYRVELDPKVVEQGFFVAPQAYELTDLSVREEVFGPILHVIRYRQNELDTVIENINSLGYGLTFGIQSRIQSTVEYIQQRIHAGNIYVNRNMVGAVVGVQPFGGSWLSGTGPKAGGPHYLSRLCIEKTLTINTTAAGGNTTLMTLDD